MSTQITVCDKKYSARIQQGYDAKDGYYYFIQIPDELLKELHWDGNMKLIAEVKLGEKNNVIVVQKY